jgi:hypothetical protein
MIFTEKPLLYVDKRIENFRCARPCELVLCYFVIAVRTCKAENMHPRRRRAGHARHAVLDY